MSREKNNQEDIWEGIWAVISLAVGEASAFLTVYPTLREIPGFSREGMTVGFGLLLAAIYFLAGLPCVNALRRGVNFIKGKFDGFRKANPEES